MIKWIRLGDVWSGLPPNAVIVTDRNVFDAWGAQFPKNLRLITIDPGEQSKSLAVYERIVSSLVQVGADRSSPIVAIGGGVVGDLAGFVAATYMRGVPFIQVPTTLLAQVDSSIGSKVGIDLPEGKNLLGAFKQPEHIYISTETLSTLPTRQFTNGMAEVLKYGFIGNASLSDHLDHISLNVKSDELESIVKTCVEFKLRVVEEDPYDTLNRRAILNFGHTIGHAIEALQGYSDLLHGEAISIGMAVEASIAEMIGVAEPGTCSEVRNRLNRYGLPTVHPITRTMTSEIVGRTKADKKVVSGSSVYSLISSIGTSIVVKGISDEVVLQALRTFPTV